MSPIEFSGEEILIDGVPGSQLVGALKAAGLSDESVTALLGRAISQSPALGSGAEATATFRFGTRIASAAPECAADFTRGFFHPDFFDGLSVVQAGQTAEELGFNARFHAIEDDLDGVSTNLSRLSNCLAELRSQVSSVIGELEDKLTEIDAALATKGKEKEGKDTKEGKEKEDKEGKDKEKEGKEGKEKDGKDRKEGKEKELKEDVDKLAPKETDDPFARVLEGPGAPASGPGTAPATEPAGAQPADRPAAIRRTFIRPDERPAVGERVLRAAGEG